MNFEKSGYVPAYTPRQAGWRRRLPPVVNKVLGPVLTGVRGAIDRAHNYLSNRRNRRRIRRIVIICILVALPFYLEILYHASTFRMVRPSENIDPVFNEGCSDVKKIAKENERANAAVVMLARNDDTDGARIAVSSFEKRFNQHFQYPIIFMNDEPFDDQFKKAMKKEISGKVSFEVIPKTMWDYSDWMDDTDKENARASMKEMAEVQGMPHAGNEGYHHMCRYESGFFYDHPALEKYEWYWRIEPDVEYTCSITYDPFLKMIESNKTYGWTIALWELAPTSPTLMYVTSEYKEKMNIPTTGLWNAMIEPSRAPWFIRNWFYPRMKDSWIAKTNHGDDWNRCHFWSNFEIAKLDFYRDKRYRDYFKYLDHSGGFHFERWGDATVHSLALALFTQPEEVHWFQDFGYRHNDYQHCPANTPLGCDCACDPGEIGVEDRCRRPFRELVTPVGTHIE